MFFVLIPGFLLGSERTVYAAGTSGLVLSFDEHGTLVVTTYGKKATTGVRYDTIGWTIKKTNGPIGAENPSARVMVEESWEEEDDEKPGYEYGHFRVYASTVYQQIKAASEEWASDLYENGGTVYLDAIMTVEENGTPKGGFSTDGGLWGEVYYNYDGISKARSWAKPEDLHNFFNHGVSFPATGYNAIQGSESIYIYGKSPEEMTQKGKFQLEAVGDYNAKVAIPSSEKLTLTATLPNYSISAKITRHYGQKLVDSGEVDYAGKAIMKLENYDYKTLDELWGHELSGVSDLGKPLFGSNANLTYNSSSGASSLTEAMSKIAQAEGEWESLIKSYNAAVGTSTYTRTRRIPADTQNGDYSIYWQTSYRLISYIEDGVSALSYGGINNTETRDLEKPKKNLVKVHTPVVSSIVFSDESAWNQQYKPTKEISLIRARTFKVEISNEGSHRKISGYGQQDYGKYVSVNRVKFPFEVYVRKKDNFEIEDAILAEGDLEKSSSFSSSFVAVPANTWITLRKRTYFYLPSNVGDGSYTVKYQSIAKNCPKIASAQMEETANLSPDHSIATGSIRINVSGRVYNFSICKVIDYPRWKAVFEEGKVYSSGSKDENGKSRSLTKKEVLPILYGSHPTENIRAIGLGYRIQFYVDTIGDFDDDGSNLLLEPQFYWVDDNFQNRQQVYLYYQKEGKLLRIGDEDTRERILSDQIITDKGRAFSFEYFYDHIILTAEERTFTEKGQRWWGEYSLPGNVYAVKSDVDLNSYVASKGGYTDYTDSIFLTGGYIIVRFEICARKLLTANLLYGNYKNWEKGYCNMWEKEGFQRVRSISETGKAQLEYGDVFVFDGVNARNADYVVYGTE